MEKIAKIFDLVLPIVINGENERREEKTGKRRLRRGRRRKPERERVFYRKEPKKGWPPVTLCPFDGKLGSTSWF